MTIQVPPPPADWRSPGFLLGHIQHCLNFYHPRALDPRGGFAHRFANDGRLLDAGPRNLVSTCRFVVIEALAYRLFGRAEYREAVRHGLDFLTQAHRNPLSGGYAWLLSCQDQGIEVVDGRNIGYGLSFAVLAFAMALKAGVSEAAPWLDELVVTMERRLYDPAHGLYADLAGADWQLDGYRGQNANMHACEAMLCAFEATGRSWFLERADSLAQAVTVRLAGQSARGEVWEHYRADWSPDWQYNRDDHSDGYRPWGHLSGHQTEWAKLLLMLDRHRRAPWHLQRAQALFDGALQRGWDGARGGLFYSWGPDGVLYDDSKQQWVHAETLAAAAHLAAATGDARYGQWYEQLWSYCWRHLVDHRHGAWLRVLDAGNCLTSSEKSEPEPDYHNIGACAELLRLSGEGGLCP
ncbi:AGE family epimerase/isomerase [Delftia sp. PS-11]|uniref:AGE family epimerase/isomerase n=1 Tax=Delftia sp. PS-11 TaxID=2767222 RepID=UPI002458A7EE|nr:AGE family epimerase/isomerase [Delftia sp. PS-11]KAJ8745345.1 AGE family epimerase/isomerase [Delftia sp. PS-11]